MVRNRMIQSVPNYNMDDPKNRDMSVMVTRSTSENPKDIYRLTDQKTKGNEKCPICLEVLWPQNFKDNFEHEEIGKDDIPVDAIACNHSFHFGCVYQWVKDEKCCPVCRTPLILTIGDQPNPPGSGMFIQDRKSVV